MSLYKRVLEWAKERNRQRRLACLRALAELDWAQGATAEEILRHGRRHSKLVTADSIYQTLHSLAEANLIVRVASAREAGERRGREPERWRITQAGRNQVDWGKPQG